MHSTAGVSTGYYAAVKRQIRSNDNEVIKDVGQHARVYFALAPLHVPALHVSTIIGTS